MFVVDAGDDKNFDSAKAELQNLLLKPTLAKIPLLVLFNKSDLPTATQPNVIAEHM